MFFPDFNTHFDFGVKYAIITNAQTIVINKYVFSFAHSGKAGEFSPLTLSLFVTELDATSAVSLLV